MSKGRDKEIRASGACIEPPKEGRPRSKSRLHGKGKRSSSVLKSYEEMGYKVFPGTVSNSIHLNKAIPSST
jgi:hypothetical protein